MGMVGVIIMVMIGGFFALMVMRLARAMDVPFSPIFQLFSHGRVGYAGGVLEHEFAAVMPRVGQETETHEREQQPGDPLGLAHLAIAPQTPEQHHGKDSERIKGEVFVLLHQLVNGVAMIDDAFDLKAGEHRGTRTERPDQQQDEAGSAESIVLTRHSNQIENHRHRKNCDGQCYEHRMDTGPVVTEHQRSGKGREP